MLHDNLAVNEKGHLTIGGLDTTELARIYGTPLYILDEDKLRANIRRYTGAMAECFGGDSMPLYAGKALCFKGIYPVIESEGMGADVVSPGEIYTALAAGFPADRLYFHGDNKTDADIAYALEQGVGCFVVDNEAELERLNDIAGRKQIRQKILLRITVGLDPHTLEAINTGRVDSQFGIPIDTGQAAEFVGKALACEHLELLGYHSHIGSQILESDPFFDQADILLAFADDMRKKYGFTAGTFNIGGGFGIRYTEADEAVDIEGNIHVIAEHLREGCTKYGYPMPRILMEPGRSIVGDACITLYEIGQVKTIRGYRSYITVDGGMTDNPRFALYKSAYTVCVANKMNEPADFECTVAGRCCESGDRIQEDVRIAKPERGDLLAVLSTGAYNYSMASNYNRLTRPPIVMISGGQHRLAVRRETFEDLINCDL
ncbi:MAG: diaminopimelate decarboxylase [Mogibacterium sp.]|nr:diaminopimelate decarboxylase [Mogibacterium sp.]